MPRRGQVHSRVTLGEYLDRWLDSKTNLSEKGRLDYEGAIESHIRPGLGHVRLRDLDRKNVREFFANLRTKGNDKKPLGEAGKHKVMVVLRACLNHAVDEDELLILNPAARLRLEKSNHKPRDKNFWTIQQQQTFLKTAKKHEPYYFPLLVTMLAGVLGQAEAFALRWRDINLKTGVASVRADLVEVEGRLDYRATKNEFRDRNFILPQVVLVELQARHQALKPKASDYVFTTPDGAPIRRTNFGVRVWFPLVKKASVPRITPHNLRKTGGSYLIAKGINPGIVHRALGHGDYRTTAKYYQGMLDEGRAAVVNAFEDLLAEI